jgi:Tol biopolymer transport system component
MELQTLTAVTHKWLALLIVGAFLTGPADSATTQLTLREGTNITLTGSATTGQLAFNLAGKIWIMDARGGPANEVAGSSRRYSQPAFSPSSDFIAVQTIINGFDQIFLLDTKGDSSPRQLTFGDFNHRTPSWSPDGRRLLLSSDRGGNFSIWELDIDSLGLTQITSRFGDEYAPAWNGDATRIVFVARETAGSALYTMTPGTAPKLLVRQPGRIYSPSWRPDNSVITYVHQTDGASQLSMTILSDPPVTKPVTRGERVFPGRVHWIDRDHFLYTGDGRIKIRRFGASEAKEIPFEISIKLQQDEFTPARPDFNTADRRPVRGIAGLTPGKTGKLVVSTLGDLWEISADGQLAEQLTNDAYVDIQPATSPDGSKLAFVSDRSGSLQLWLMDREKHELRVLTKESGMVMHPQWNNSDQSLVFLVAETPLADGFILKRISLATGESKTLAERLLEPSAPSWHWQQGIILATHAPGEANAGAGPSRFLQFDADTGAKMTLAPPNLSAREITAPRWSPDGQRLMFTADRALFVTDVNSGAPQLGEPQLVHPGPISHFRWSAANQAVLFSENGGLVNINIETGQSVQLSQPVSWRPAIPNGRKIIRAGRIFNGIAPTYLERQEIVIEANRIVDIRPWSEHADNAEYVIDARKHTVMPGLIDLAVRQRPASSERSGRTWLAFGVTGIREDVRLPAEAMEQYESWRHGRRPGPRLFMKGRACSWLIATPELMTEAAQQFASTGGTTITGCPGLTYEEEREIIASSHSAGLSFASDAPFPGLMIAADEVPLMEPAQAELSLRAYGDVIDSISITGASVVSRQGPLGLPELARHTPILGYKRYRVLYSEAERDWYESNLAKRYDSSGAILRAASRSAGQSLFIVVGRGGRVATGSNAPLTPPGLGLHVELQLLAQTGLQPFQVLKMATLDAARTLGLSSDLGSVEPGKLADLIIVKGDPLADITATADVIMTMVGGRPYYLTDLLQPNK